MAVKIHVERFKDAFFGRKLFDGITVFLLAVAILGGVVLSVQQLQPQAYDPLGVYAQQTVGVNSEGERLLPFETYGLETFPTLRIVTGEEKLPVYATKCNNSDGPVQITGETRWQPVDPPGISLLVGKGTASRAEKCTTFNYMNPIPPEVLAVVKRLHDEEGVSETRWKIAGTETPVDPQGGPSVTRTWESDTFVVRYEMP